MSIKVIFLGTGDAFGSGGRGNTALAIVNEDRTILLDCGASLLPAAETAGLDVSGIEAISFTHAHGDHISGWPFLRLYYQFIKPRTAPLALTGPPGVDRVLEQITPLFYPELDSRPPDFEMTFHTVSDGSVVTVGDAEITAVAVTHQQDHPAVGYRVSWGGRTVAFSGDASWCDGLKRLAAGADLFICECCNMENPIPVHLSYSQLEANAKSLTCGQLILTHCGPDVLARQDELAWPVAYDGLVIEL